MSQAELGHVRPTHPGPVVAAAVLGLVGGWSLRPVAQWLGEVPPLVTWVQVGVLYFVALFLAAVAWQTRRLVSRPLALAPNRAVNRLVLAKACILVGAVVAGGYGGYALTWIGSESALVGERILRSGLGSLAGLLILLAAIWLERCCRVREDDDAEPSM